MSHMAPDTESLKPVSEVVDLSKLSEPLTYEEHIKRFRPRFGNPNHIRVRDLVEKIKKNTDKIEKEKKMMKGITSMQRENESLKRQVIWILTCLPPTQTKVISKAAVPPKKVSDTERRKNSMRRGNAAAQVTRNEKK